MTRFTLIALKMALPSATSVCQDVRHTRAHYLSHTSGRNTHLQDSQRPQRSISRLVPWGYSVQSGGLASVSGRGKMKIRAERKTTAEQRKSGRQVLQTFRCVVQCQQDVFRVKKKRLCLWHFKWKNGVSSQSIYHLYTHMPHILQPWHFSTPYANTGTEYTAQCILGDPLCICINANLSNVFEVTWNHLFSTGGIVTASCSLYPLLWLSLTVASCR